MEAQKRKLRSRKPLSDLTNNNTHISSHSSSSSAITTASTHKHSKHQLSSARNKHLSGNFKAGETSGSISDRTASVNATSAPPPLDSTPARPPPPNFACVSVKGSRDGVSEPCSVYSRRMTSDKSKNKGKDVAELVISSIAAGDRSDDIGNIILEQISKSLAKKKQRFMPHERNMCKDVLPRDYIENQKAYFDEIDLEPLSVEEIASDAEQD